MWLRYRHQMRHCRQRCGCGSMCSFYLFL